MYNRYLSSAQPQRVEEPIGAPTQRAEEPGTVPPHRAEEPAGAPPPQAAGILQRLQRLLGRLSGGEEKSLFAGIPLLEKLESGDLLLILVLIFLFRESEDEEWLIILALVLLMGL